MFLNGHELVDIPAGMSCLGSSELDPYAGDLEFPMREVYVSEFRIARHPTTRRQMTAFRRAVGWELASDTWQSKGRAGPGGDSALDLPAVNVSWELAVAYCGWLSERSGLAFALPTEAEWEKAARGGDDRIWPWGNEFRPDLCNSAEDGRNAFRSVYQVAEGASPYGCLHMAGGVWEWCEDYYHSRAHQEAQFIDPFAARPASRRVVKGGSAYCTKEIVRPACRDWTNSYNQGGADDGFRVCVRSWR
ncbi:formylglycine-generating enzyme family protein [Streptomyces griseoviridis]|uniref:formylglycine-generating enzyme family protein n=1 Tax=Streptomyces griseoviridis TaxID=45398 RepID=UPI003425DD44